MAVSDDEFNSLKKDHERLRMVTMSLTGLVCLLAVRAGADPADTGEFKKAFPEVGYDLNKMLNASLRIAKSIAQPA